MACPLWDAGYRDQALIHYAALLAAGFPYHSEQRRDGCFAYRARAVGIRVARLDQALRPFVADPGDPFEAELLRRLETATASSESHWQAEHVLACLNHRHDLRLLAATNFTAGEQRFGAGDGVRRIRVPAACLDIARHYHVVRTPDGVTAMPDDAERRFFVPGRSPVPYEPGSSR